jgi:hypothetical protein
MIKSKRSDAAFQIFGLSEVEFDEWLFCTPVDTAAVSPM